MDRRLSARIIVATFLFVGCGLFPDVGDLEGTDAALLDAGTDHADSDAATIDAGDGAPDVSNGCPSGRGPAMIRVTDTYGSFCVDSTEVTNAQYHAMSGAPSLPPECKWKTGVTAVGENDDLPVASVDWCDAFAFCAWAGKHLCGSRNGAPIDDFGPADDPQVSEWYAACSRSGSRLYPYGATFAATACNGCDRTSACANANGAPATSVGSLAGCNGGYDGIFDMSGNVAEWTNDCDDAGGGKNDDCPPLGGSREGDAGALTCTATEENINGSVRSDTATDVGFRCCAAAP
ncbi:MAG TPA: SUMF1/EgtB/PvdO family nonheme iron enzyme [Polyangiaceae bacterium]|nr:SUMF1/EgtB/PvdO family nonheme iron enzyme [Polyangiaceae bacterium]